MAIGYLNERTKKVIDMVLKQSSAFAIREIADGLSVSTRTVYNELERAGDWLEMKGLPKLRIIRGKVQPFSLEERLALETAVQAELSGTDYIFTPGERAQIIVCLIIVSTEPVYVEELMNACFVSRNTIFTDLQAVISRLYTWQLKLCYEKKTGYRIDGDPIGIRALFFLYFKQLEPLLSAGKLNFPHWKEIDPCLKQIECIERELQVSYVRSDMLALAAIMPVMRKGDEHLFFSGVSTRKVRDSEEYRLVSLHFPELTDTEKTYLTLHFLGGRLASYSRTGPEAENESIREITRNLVAEFERKACVTFEKNRSSCRICTVILLRFCTAIALAYRSAIPWQRTFSGNIRISLMSCPIWRLLRRWESQGMPWKYPWSCSLGWSPTWSWRASDRPAICF